MPYLSINEESEYIAVVCDGFVFRCYFGDTETQDRIMDSTGVTHWVRFFDMLRSGSTTYSMYYDTSRTLEIIENTPTRIVLRKVGRFKDGDQNELDADDFVTYHYVVYPDRVCFSLKWINDTDTIMDDSTAQKLIAFEDLADITGEVNINEANDTEESGNLSTYYNTAKYIGMESDQVNIIGVAMENSDSNFIQYLGTVGSIYFGWDDVTLLAGTHTISVVFIIDSAEREVRT